MDEFVEFEWDSDKSEQTREQRGLDFRFASGIFEGSVVERADVRRDYGEPRLLLLAKSTEL